jgi:hypothetical protein
MTERKTIGVDHQRQAQRQADDVKILQKVNANLRDGFLQRYPTQVEHCLRLTMERLQAGLDKRDGVVLDRPETWRMSTVEVFELAQTAYYLNEIRKGF